MLDKFLNEVGRCTTVNQFNRLRIGIENTFAPAEICTLIDGVRERNAEVPEYCARWLANSDESMRGGGRTVQPYVRHSLLPEATMYAAPGTAAERASRTLVVAYTSDADRLFMPIAVFLQHVPAATHEVMLLIDLSRRFYLGGITGMGDDLPSTIRRIDAIAAPSRYRRAVGFGCSAGGLAAIWTAIELNFPRAVSVGGIAPESVADREQTYQFDLSGFDNAIRRRFKLPEIMLVRGEMNDRDTKKALQMADRLPAKHVTVQGAADHNVLYEVWKGGRLGPFLAELID
ncbi:MAG TPA: hypothetical protein VII68_08080 [Casimicrobiaceae bacterium]